jgi:hypothetical protein
MRLTKEQEQICKHVSSSNKDLGVIAGAGCGKSSTCGEVCSQNKSKRPLYLAFNKAIADEFARKNPGVQALTQNSFCFRLLKQRENFRVKNHGVMDISRILDIDIGAAYKVRDTLNKFYYSKHTKLKFGMTPSFSHIEDEDVRRIARDQILLYANDFYRYVKERKEYSHDAYVKVVHAEYPDLVNRQYGILAVDEFQDSNPAFVEVMNRHDSQKILIGDPMQSIYQWRGAVDSFSSFKGKKLTLSVSFRFPAEIAELANEIISVRDTDFRLKGMAGYNPIPGRSSYLQRTNIGCLFKALELDERNLPFILKGGVSKDEKDILWDMYNLYYDNTYNLRSSDCKAMKNFNDIEELIESEEGSGEWTNRERLINKLGGYSSFMRQIEYLEERSNLHQKNPNARIITTGHKAKGEEWPHVYVGGDFLSKFKTDEEQSLNTGLTHSISAGTLEEQNLLYVAVTRGMRGVDIAEIHTLFPNHSALIGGVQMAA